MHPEKACKLTESAGQLEWKVILDILSPAGAEVLLLEEMWFWLLEVEQTWKHYLEQNHRPAVDRSSGS